MGSFKLVPGTPVVGARPCMRDTIQKLLAAEPVFIVSDHGHTHKGSGIKEVTIYVKTFPMQTAPDNHHDDFDEGDDGDGDEDDDMNHVSRLSAARASSDAKKRSAKGTENASQATPTTPPKKFPRQCSDASGFVTPPKEPCNKMSLHNVPKVTQTSCSQVYLARLREKNSQLAEARWEKIAARDVVVNVTSRCVIRADAKEQLRWNEMINKAALLEARTPYDTIS